MTPEQRIRYSRNILLAEFGKEAQERLLSSDVAIVGCGALGSVAAMYLAGSGIGSMRLADFDTVGLSNLQRQLAFTVDDCDKPKLAALTAKVKAVNPDVEVTGHDSMLTRASVGEFIDGADLVLECSDNPSTKYLVTDAAAAAGIPYVFGGVAQWQGQVLSWRIGSPTYRQLFPEAEAEGGYMPCSIGGVLGPLPGIIGSVMAAEAIKIIAGVGSPLFGRLFVMDSLSMTSRVVNLD